MLDTITSFLAGTDINTTIINIVAFFSLINLIGFLFLLIGSFIGASRR